MPPSQMKFQQKQDGRIRVGGGGAVGGKLEEDADRRTRAERQQRGQTLEQRKDVIRETVGKREKDREDKW